MGFVFDYLVIDHCFRKWFMVSASRIQFLKGKF